MTPREKKPTKSGPKPETIRIEEGDVDWKDALKHAMGKPKPDQADDSDKPKEKDQRG